MRLIILFLFVIQGCAVYKVEKVEIFNTPKKDSELIYKPKPGIIYFGPSNSLQVFDGGTWESNGFWKFTPKGVIDSILTTNSQFSVKINN
jgi:hypothetical protein